MRRLVIALAACLSIPALAQTPPAAISASLSPADVAAAFEDAVLNACAASVSTGATTAALPQAVRQRLVPGDAETRRLAGASASDAVFDVVAAKGVVTLREGGGQCVVSAYGPPAAMTLQALAIRFTSDGYERLAAAPGPTGLDISLTRTAGGRRVQVLLSGSEPGMPGHRSRFSVVTATLFSTPG